MRHTGPVKIDSVDINGKNFSLVKYQLGPRSIVRLQARNSRGTAVD